MTPRARPVVRRLAARPAGIGASIGLCGVLSGALWLAVSGCGGGFRFFEVLRTPVEECDILPQGEFCETEGLAAPEVEVWTIDARDRVVRVTVDGELWLADGPDPDAPARIAAERTDVQTRAPGPCTSTTTRGFVLEDAGATFEGTLSLATRLTGPPACGATPRGSRTTIELLGTEVASP